MTRFDDFYRKIKLNIKKSRSDFNADEFRQLVHLGKNMINDKKPSGKTVLMLASEHTSDNSLNILAELIKNGADVNAADNRGKTPLMYCFDYQHYHTNIISKLDCIKFLISSGADVNALDDRNDSALIFAIENYHCFSNKNFDIDNLEYVKILVENGAIINNYGGFHPILVAARTVNNYSVKCFKYLLDKGADVNVCSDDGFNILSHMIDSDISKYPRILFVDIIKVLLNYNFDLNHIINSDEYSWSSLIGLTNLMLYCRDICSCVDLGIIVFLLDMGANANILSPTNRSALSYLCENFIYEKTHKENFELILVKSKSVINVKDNDQKTPYDYFCKINDAAILPNKLQQLLKGDP